MSITHTLNLGSEINVGFWKEYYNYSKAGKDCFEFLLSFKGRADMHM